MPAATVVSVEEYLSSSYRPDCDYVDGDVRERNVGEYPRSKLLTKPPLICMEILSGDDRLRDMQERVNDYLNFGVPNVWILDPVLKKAYVCTRSGFQDPASGILEVADSTIRVPLTEVFAELDE